MSQTAPKTIAVSLLVYYFLLRSYDLVHSDIPKYYHLCPNTTAQLHDGLFQQNLDNLLASLSSNASISNFFATSSSSDPKIYGLYMCYGYNTHKSCETCVKAASQKIKTVCPNATEAVRWEEECQLRYSNKEFFGAVDVAGYKELNNSVHKHLDRERFRSFATRVLSELAEKAAPRRVHDKELPLHNRNDSSGIDLNMHHLKSNRFEYATINEATRNFDESNMLGQGGFGPVYKGKLSDGREIAVKRLSSYSEQGLEEFTNEIKLTMKLQHKNIVRLLGFCGNGEEKLLIYELMPNGSLDGILFDPTKRVQLDWKSRLNIINGIARGMLYLHENSRLRIIHRDIKASNILLDNHMNPKISDFGMARIFVGSDGEASTCRLVGTYGYMAPEYAMEGYYSIKSDVFSFGVLLLEIIIGKTNSSFQQSLAPNLISYAWQLWNEGKELELMDPLLTEFCARDAFRKCVHIGLLCVQEDANDRPTMSSVVVMLNGETEALQQPERPAFSWGTSNDYDESNVDSFSFTNVNMLSVSCSLEKE